MFNFLLFEKDKTNVLSETKPEVVLLDKDKLRKAILILWALNHKLRQTMIDLLEENKSMTVTDVHIKLSLAKSDASLHLGILRMAKVVIVKKQGKFRLYSVNRKRLKKIFAIAKKLSGPKRMKSE